MTFAAFRQGAQALATETQASVKFQNDEDTGKYFARFSDGTVITGSASGFGLTVRWNNNQHQARARLRNGRICAA